MAFLFLIYLAGLLFLPFSSCYLYQNTSIRHSNLRVSKKDDWLFASHEIGSNVLKNDTNRTLSCQDDLQGFGSLDTICALNDSTVLDKDSLILGEGSLILAFNVSISCPIRGCTIEINLSGDLYMGRNASIVAGTVIIDAVNFLLAEESSLNTTGLGGSPPAQTSGTPLGLDGAGGGHGGRGAFCVKGDGKDQEDAWGGDVYSWSSLTAPWSYGSRGGTTSREDELGGGGGGRILVVTSKWLNLNGTLSADGGYAGVTGGGGSGGSIRILTYCLNGSGEISASGGTGWAGGGGGRVAVDSIEQEGVIISIHGGDSLGCPDNAGAAGTRFDLVLQSLIVSNSNKSTETDTLLMEFPTYPLWESVHVENYAKVAIPLLWSRVQVQEEISLQNHGTLSSGLSHYPFSEFELVADEVKMMDSTIKVYGALKLSVKMLRMWNSSLQIDGGGGIMVAYSTVDASNFILLRDGSTIISNSNLGVHGQGFFKLKGPGDAVKSRRLFLSLFYNVHIGPEAVLQAPLHEDSSKDELAILNCKNAICPSEIIQPPEDCNLNISLPFTLQICRVEDVIVDGSVKGSIIHIHRARTVTINAGGLVTASGQGCKGGFGQGALSSTGVAGGGGHGGKGGKGHFNGSWADGGGQYGSKSLPCELGSGSGNSTSERVTSGGGIVVIGSLEHRLSSLDIYGAVTSDGESYHLNDTSKLGGVGGGSGGSLLFFLQTLTMGNASLLSTAGGNGSPVGGGGGGAGRIHFHWSDIAIRDDFIPIANIKGSISLSGGVGSDDGMTGEEGTVTGKDCPYGLYGVFCKECPIGTYKNEVGSDDALCKPCSLERLPRRGKFVYVRGGVTFPSCPYKCLSDKYRMPRCYTPLEELIYAFGGPWTFGFLLSGLLVLLALVLSVARVKIVGTDDLDDLLSPTRAPPVMHIDHSLPFLESMNEVLEKTRVGESQNHVHRLYFMGSNSFSEPWHLPHLPPIQIMELIYEDAFNRFVDDINCLAAYQWWEGSVHGILAVLAYPLSYTWQQWRRRRKVQRLREYVRSEYDHSCLRSCRSRALYEGIKVAATPDLILGYMDFFLGGDEKRPDLPPPLSQRLPLSIIFGGDGSYMAAYHLHSDNLFTSLLGQAVPATMWYRLVAGLNGQLRTVRQGCLQSTLSPVVDWLATHANPHLFSQGVHAGLAWFQATSSEHFQLGLVIDFASEVPQTTMIPDLNSSFVPQETSSNAGHIDQPLLWQGNKGGDSLQISHGRIAGGLIDRISLRFLEDKKYLSPFSLILHNVRPFGHQDVIGLIVSILLLGDFSLTLLTLLQFYSISIPGFLTVLLVFPLASLMPFFMGMLALFSYGPQRSADYARVYGLWNTTSLANSVAALCYGMIYYKVQSCSSGGAGTFHAFHFTIEESGWWLFPTALFTCKVVQAQVLDRHIANLEIRDHRIFSKDPVKFWDS